MASLCERGWDTIVSGSRGHRKRDKRPQWGKELTWKVQCGGQVHILCLLPRVGIIVIIVELGDDFICLMLKSRKAIVFDISCIHNVDLERDGKQYSSVPVGHNFFYFKCLLAFWFPSQLRRVTDPILEFWVPNANFYECGHWNMEPWYYHCLFTSPRPSLPLVCSPSGASRFRVHSTWTPNILRSETVYLTRH